MREATNNFSDANKLGQGGFGSVYKVTNKNVHQNFTWEKIIDNIKFHIFFPHNIPQGRLPDGQEIAVKRLAGHSTQGEEQFMNEVSLVAKLQHRNLVRLLGFCSEEGERVLVYELLCNGSLDHIIFGTHTFKHC